MSVLALRASALDVDRGGAVVLQGFDFEVPEGSFAALIGPNGAGKSTLIAAILGILIPSRGSLEVLGGAPGENAGAVGYVPQRKSLDVSFPALASELVMTGVEPRWPFARSRKAVVTRALERVGGGHLAGRSVSDLSGGELQRVFLARALARSPRMLILDEPATGIDVTGEADMYGMLEAFQEETGATVVMATHDLDAAEHHASHVLLMARRQVAFGAPEVALSEAHLRTAFSHVGHAHPLGMTHSDA